MTKIRNIVFDFDGTLVDTAPLILQTMEATIQEMGLPPKSETEYRATIGLRLEEIPAVLWPEYGNLSQTYATTYRRIFDELKRPQCVICYPGVLTTLRYLHDEGYKMAIASSRSRRSLEEYIAFFGLDSCFDKLIGGNDVVNGKPAPDPVLAILHALGWDAGETLTVGDAPVDILMGRAAGTTTCAVSYGNSSRGLLAAATPDFIIDSFDQLKTLI